VGGGGGGPHAPLTDSEAKNLSGPTLDEWIAHERARSHRFGGRTVFGGAEPESDDQLTRRAMKKRLSPSR
jgi:hypothetical protein